MALPSRRATSALAAAVLVPTLVVGLGALPAHAGVTASCDGLAATIVGTGDNDMLAGTDGPDVIAALGGRDRIVDLGEGDTACGNEGDDHLFIKAGGAKVLGGLGKDQLEGSASDDMMLGGQGRDYLFGEGGEDTLRGGAQGDRLQGDDGDDDMRGGAGADGLYGGNDGDLMVGGESPSDFVDYQENDYGVFVDLRAAGADNGNMLDGPQGARDTIRSIEEVVGSRGNDRILGDGADNTVYALTGYDEVSTRGGDDFILTFGDRQRDVVDCGTGQDEVQRDVRRDLARHCEDT